MSEIICPYCCKRFQPTRMVFRLNRSLEENTEEQKTDNQWEVAGRSSGNRKVDVKFKQYLIDFEGVEEREAEVRASFDAETIEINFADMLQDISDYNQAMYDEHKFVLELTYKGQKLNKRLCPECHNELIPNAGLYDMKIIAMYGDTNAGKTVYLNILEAALRGDPRINLEQCAFQGSMFYQGNDQELREHDRHYNLLLGEHKLPKATESGRVVKPQVFRYCYRTADRPAEDKNLLIVFRDIPGEDIRSPEKLHRYGFYLKNSDGIIVMLDATKLTHVIPFLNTDGSQIGNLNVSQALGNLADLLTVINGGNKIGIPTAVVLAKADIFGQVLQGDNAGLYNRINTSDANNIHINYMNRKVVKNLNDNVKNILQNLRETPTILNPVEHCFSDFSYFAVSALGENPVSTGDEKCVTYIRPMRVTEPFYWLLSKLSYIPYYHEEKWENRRVGSKHVKMYYYEKERNGIAQRRLEDQKQAQGIKNGFWGPKWELKECNDSI